MLKKVLSMAILCYFYWRPMLLSLVIDVVCACLCQKGYFYLCACFSGWPVYALSTWRPFHRVNLLCSILKWILLAHLGSGDYSSSINIDKDLRSHRKTTDGMSTNVLLCVLCEQFISLSKDYQNSAGNNKRTVRVKWSFFWPSMGLPEKLNHLCTFR